MACGFNKNLNTYIENRWKFPLPMEITNENVIKKDLNYWGYIVLKLPNEHILKLLQIDMSKYGYTQWSNLKEGVGFDDINIESENFLFCKAKDTGNYINRSVYVNKHDRIVIFLDCNWAGY